MDEPHRKAWIRAALLVGLVYFLVGKLFSLPTDHAHAWRWAAWIVSAIAYAAHIAYEHLTLRSAPHSTALHAALGAAVGAFALALAGMAHSLMTGAALRPVWLLALVVWPAGTAVPAFLVALVAAATLRHFGQRADTK